jgi:hypothetical protein
MVRSPDFYGMLMISRSRGRNFCFSSAISDPIQIGVDDQVSWIEFKG